MSIKATELAKTITQLAQEHPGATAKCVYFNADGGPCCIVGTGLAAHGVDPGPFLASTDLNQWTGVGELTRRYGGEYIEVDGDEGTLAVDFLYYVQLFQDRGLPWGEAVADAERRIAEVEAKRAENADV